MVDFTIPSNPFSEKTLEAARGLMCVLNHHGCQDHDIAAARDRLITSIKHTDGLYDIYMTEPEQFQQCCADAVARAAQKFSDVGEAFKKCGVNLGEILTVEYTIGEYQCAAHAVMKKDSMVRVRDGLSNAIGKTLELAPEYLASGITGFLAQNLVPPVNDGTVQHQRAGGNSLEAMTRKLKPLVSSSLDDMKPDEQKTHDRVLATVMHDIVCTEWYLGNLQTHPPYLAKAKVGM